MVKPGVLWKWVFFLASVAFFLVVWQAFATRFALVSAAKVVLELAQNQK